MQQADLHAGERVMLDDREQYRVPSVIVGGAPADKRDDADHGSVPSTNGTHVAQPPVYMLRSHDQILIASTPVSAKDAHLNVSQ